MSESYVTIATDNISCLGCLVLCNSLKQTGTEKVLSVLVSPNVSYHMRSVLQKSFDKVYYTNDLYAINPDGIRIDVHGEYERLKCWLLSDFSKCVFLESDVLVIENIDDLFDRTELSAATDPKWPDHFDVGVLVIQPSIKTYKDIVRFSSTNQPMDDNFKCLLNMFFSDWNLISMERKIPFIYNCQINATFYTHTTALVHFGHSIKAARLGDSLFSLLQSGQPSGSSNNDTWEKLWVKWWKIFNEMVKPAVDADDTLHFKRTGCDYGQQSTPANQENYPPRKESSYSTFNKESVFPSQTHVSSNVESTAPKQEPLQPNEEAISEHVAVPFSVPNETSSGAHQESMFPNQESSCPSQHMFEASPFTTNYSEKSTEDTYCQTLTDTLVTSPTEIDVSEMDDDVKEVENIATNSEEVERDHRLRWERGEIDYMGEDSFANILAKLTFSLVEPTDEIEVVPTEE